MTAKKNKMPKPRAITSDPLVVWLLLSLGFLIASGAEVVVAKEMNPECEL